MKLDDLDLRISGSQHGISLYDGNNYINDYLSVHELVLDLVYRFEIDEIERVAQKFQRLSSGRHTIEPYKYRGVCSEIFWPLDNHPYRFVYYCNSLSELFSKFAFHEERAVKYPDHFDYAPQGTGIHLFNDKTLKYELWIGGSEIKTVSDVMRRVKEEGLTIPSSLQEEFQGLGVFDVFVSHKSEDYKLAKTVYDTLSSAGYRVFLSEIVLPAVANADYVAEICKALDNSRHLVVIADSYAKISSGWVNYEWSSFLNEKLSGRKDGNIVTLVTQNMRPQDLPFSLRQFEVVGIHDLSQLPQWFSNN